MEPYTFNEWQKKVGRYISYRKLASLKSLEVFAYYCWKKGFYDRQNITQQFSGQETPDEIWTNEDESAEIERQITEESCR